MKTKIFTHCDYDGAASAAILSYFLHIYDFEFITPNAVWERTITENDIVADLPCPRVCQMWFDHHASNGEALRDLQKDPADIPGKWQVAPSAAQVISDYFEQQGQTLPERFRSLVATTNIIDTMGYADLDEWLEPSPHNVIDAAISLRKERFAQVSDFLRQLTEWFRDEPLEAIAQKPLVQERYRKKCQEWKEDENFLQKAISFLPEDRNRRMVIIDSTAFSYAPRVEKNLVLKLDPNAELIVSLSCEFKQNRKTNNVKVSIGMNFLKQNSFDKDLGGFLAELNVGGGHPKAAGGFLYSQSKLERQQNITDFLYDLYAFWTA